MSNIPSSSKPRQKSRLAGDGISSSPVRLLFEASHNAGSELRKVTCNVLSSAMERIPAVGGRLHIPGLQSIPGKAHNLLSNADQAGFSSRSYRRFCDQPILALHSIHYCVRGRQNPHNLSGDLIKRLTEAREKGSKEQRVEAIEELRSSLCNADTAGPEAIPELCEKLKESTPDEVRRMEHTEDLKALLLDDVVRVRPSLVSHQFLVLELHDQLDDGKVDRHFILAEKLGEPPGIHIRKEPPFDSLFKKLRGAAVLFEVQCGTGKHFTLSSLEAILLDFDMDYRLADSCCWDYALRICKALLQACADLPSTSIHDKLRLYDEIKSVPAKCGFHSVFGFMEKVMAGKR